MNYLCRKIRIVIIDSGIDVTKAELKKFVKESIGFNYSNGDIEELKNPPILHEHGTAIAIIIKNLCSNIEFISINILDKDLCSYGYILIKAINKAILYKPDIIHLSLGTKKLKYYFLLKKVIKKAKQNNILVVSATSNDGKRSYPSYMKGVIGVKTLDNENYRYYYKRGFYYACGYIDKFIECNQLKENKMQGNSFAAAYITGYISQEINKRINSGYNNHNILKILKEKGKGK